MAHIYAHDDYVDKLRRLAESTQKRLAQEWPNSRQLLRNQQQRSSSYSDKDPTTKYVEIEMIKALLPDSVREEIEKHKTELALKIGILTLSEILERLDVLAEYIKENPEKARAGVAKLSPAAKKPAGDIIRIFVSDKTPREKREEIKKIKDSLPTLVLGEINYHKEDIAKKIGVAPLHN